MAGAPAVHHSNPRSLLEAASRLEACSRACGRLLRAKSALSSQLARRFLVPTRVGAHEKLARKVSMSM